MVPVGNRVPTDAEYRAYTGGHTHLLWRETPETWHCPGCGRSKRELLTWTKRQRGSHAQFDGWIAPLVGHHDHSGDVSGLYRFPETVICNDCNAADGRATLDRRRRDNLEDGFSFSPAEIGTFIVATPHSPHVVDLEKAWRLYRAFITHSMTPTQAEKLALAWPKGNTRIVRAYRRSLVDAAIDELVTISEAYWSTVAPRPITHDLHVEAV
jgi:hypothetical protein